MNLNEEQKTQVRQWIEQGLSAAAIQTKLQDELGLKATYAEVRFLLGDLQVAPKDQPKAATPILGGGGAGVPQGGTAGSARAPGPAGRGPAPMPPGPPAGPGPADGGLRTTPLADDEAPTGGRVAVTVDQIARPGMVVSGKVTFSDGQQAEWGIDQMGRPMLMPKTAGYRPSQGDVMDFQAELETLLSRMGY